MRHIIVSLFLIVSLLAKERPNIVFINVDDMSTDSIGAYGCTIKNITPNIDKLAAEGITFEKAHVTIAICQPSRSVWLTGRYPHNSGGLGFHNINADCPSLPEALKNGGYYNALIGKALHIVPTRQHAFDYIRDQKELGQGRSPSEYADAIRTAIEGAKKANKPFFIMASAHDPHRPFADSDSDYKKLPPVTRTITPEEAIIPVFLPDLPNIRKELAQYFTSVHRADEVTGAILAEIDKAGLTENTLVIFMSDNGIPLPFAKANCFLNSTSTPWIMRWPVRIKPGSRDSKHFVSGIDFTPTILEAVSLENLPGTDGSSIMPILDGNEVPTRDKVFTHINSIFGNKQYPMRAVNNGEYLYIWNQWSDGETIYQNESMSGLSFKAMEEAAKTDPNIAKRIEHLLYRTKQELYDIRKDPNCLNNLIAKPNNKYTEKAKTMADILRAEMQKTKDPQLKSFISQVSPTEN